MQRRFYRTGLIREEIPLRNGRKHGVTRTWWHKNGVLACEEPYQNGVPHGICRQRDGESRMPGQYKTVRGTGIQRAWHVNGQLQMEVPTVRGEFCGRTRIWLRETGPCFRNDFTSTVGLSARTNTPKRRQKTKRYQGFVAIEAELSVAICRRLRSNPRI